MLNFQRINYEHLQQQLTQSFNGLDKNIERKLAEFETLLKNEVEKIRPEFEVIFNGFLDSLTYKFKNITDLLDEDSNKILSDFILEKDTLIQGLHLFKESQEQEIKKIISDIENAAIYKIESKLIETEEKQKKFIENQNKIIQNQKILIDNLNLQLSTLKVTNNQDKLKLLNEINDLKDNIQENHKRVKDEMSAYSGILFRESDKKFEKIKKEIEDKYMKKLFK